MCGLVGVFGHIGDREKRIFANLHAYDVVRGTDSSGILRVDKDNNTSVLKGKGVPFLLHFEDECFLDDSNLVMGDDLKLIMGHNRKTTSGATNKENAHPFEFKNLIGAHNGTLKNHTLNKFNNEGLTVDTQKMYNALSQVHDGELKGFSTYKDVLEQIEGAAAMTWWVKPYNNLKIFKNDERPLSFVTSKDDRTLYWASESWMLRTALSEFGEKNFNPVRNFKDDCIITFSISKKGKLSCRVSDKITMDSGHYRTTTYTPAQSSFRANNNQSAVIAGPSVFYVNNLLVTKEDYIKTAMKGCSCCGTENIPWEDRFKVGLLDDFDLMLCSDCVKIEGIEAWVGDFSKGHSNKVSVN